MCYAMSLACQIKFYIAIVYASLHGTYMYVGYDDFLPFLSYIENFSNSELKSALNCIELTTCTPAHGSIHSLWYITCQLYMYMYNESAKPL